MIKADYIYKGKELKGKLQNKLELLQQLLLSKEKELNLLSGTIINDSNTNNLNNILGIGTFLNNENDPEAKKSNLNSVINETKFQINKCMVLLTECTREPRKKFILDFDEVYWLNF